MTSAPSDGWNAASTYEEFMGRRSRPVAGEFVRRLDAEPGGHWLDVGTGTGALAAALCTVAQPASVVACDPSAPFVEFARQVLADARVTFEVAGVGSLPLREGGYDAVVSQSAIWRLSNPSSTLRVPTGCEWRR